MIAAAVVLGVGLGGFFDGIVLHQILQWHHMVSAVDPPASLAALELNTFFDGLFHAGTWIVTLAGVWMLFLTNGEQERRGRNAVLGGGVFLGWGGFNLVEGLIDHYLLQLHHVRPGPDQALWDAAFLAWGAAFVVAGWLVLRSAAR